MPLKENGVPMSTEAKIERIGAFFARVPQIKFAYVFGSCARGDHGPASDLDIAVFLDRRVSSFAFRLRLIETMMQELGTERFDLIILNDAPPVLKYEVVRQGRVIKEDKKRRVEFEAKSLGEYLDTAYLRETQQAYLKEQLRNPST
jgi:predicted nucleotidyltransferase